MYRYDAWGNFQGTAGPTAAEPSLAYAGQHWDADVGLSYAQQRWYEPGTGRFLSEDPVFGDLGRPGSLHQWTYANGNPLLYLDPEGTAGVLDLFQAMAMPTSPSQSSVVRQTVEASREVVEQSPKVLAAAGAAPLLIAAAVPVGAAAVPAVTTSIILTAAKAGGAVVIAESAVDAVGVGVGAHGCFVLQDPRSCLDMSASALDLAAGPAPVAEALLADRATRRKGLKGPTGAEAPLSSRANTADAAPPSAARAGVPPGDVNFSQRTVGANVEEYTADMKAGSWDWGRSGPLRVMEQEGQLVSYDNRRLMAARQAGLGAVPIQIVEPGAQMPGSNRTWGEAFYRRLNDPRNVSAGGPVPPGGLSTLPKAMTKK